MLHSLSLISKFAFVFIFIILGGSFVSCRSGADKKRIDRVVESSLTQKIYMYSFDSVWRASQLTLKYPISVNNMDSGVLETEWIQALDGFQSPTETKLPSSGVRYKITLTLTRGKAQNKESVRVNIFKKIERKRDFFSEPEPLQSDGLEEQVIFYRIERELVIEEALKKAQEKGKL
jgi:hypothetical protein